MRRLFSFALYQVAFLAFAIAAGTFASSYMDSVDRWPAVVVTVVVLKRLDELREVELLVDLYEKVIGVDEVLETLGGELKTAWSLCCGGLIDQASLSS